MPPKHNPVIRRIPDESGKLVTYLALREITKLIGFSNTTIYKWVQAGAVRSPGMLCGEIHASILDATLLAILPPKRTLELGLRRTPMDRLVYTRGKLDEYQQHTVAEGPHENQHPWDDYDIQYVAHRFAEGIMDAEDIAKELGRTYYAVVSVIQRLRANGDLPRVKRGPRRIEDVERLLTASEAAMLHAA